MILKHATVLHSQLCLTILDSHNSCHIILFRFLKLDSSAFQNAVLWSLEGLYVDKAVVFCIMTRSQAVWEPARTNRWDTLTELDPAVMILFLVELKDYLMVLLKTSV